MSGLCGFLRRDSVVLVRALMHFCTLAMLVLGACYTLSPIVAWLGWRMASVLSVFDGFALPA